MSRKIFLLLLSLVMMFSMSCYAYDDGNNEEGSGDEPVRNEEQVRGEHVRVQLKDGTFRDVFIPSDQPSEGPDNRMRRDRVRRSERERVQKNDNERRMTRREWE